eukprot:1308676-Amphidinium_carterae.1
MNREVDVEVEVDGEEEPLGVAKIHVVDVEMHLVTLALLVLVDVGEVLIKNGVEVAEVHGEVGVDEVLVRVDVDELVLMEVSVDEDVDEFINGLELIDVVFMVVTLELVDGDVGDVDVLEEVLVDVLLLGEVLVLQNMGVLVLVVLDVLVLLVAIDCDVVVVHTSMHAVIGEATAWLRAAMAAILGSASFAQSKFLTGFASSSAASKRQADMA